MQFFLPLYQTPPALTEKAMDATLAGTPAAPGYTAAQIAKLKALYDPAAYPYPPAADRGKFSEWYWMLMRIQTDTVPGLGPCAVRNLDRLLLAGGTPAVFSYLFAHPPQEGGLPGEAGGVFAPHASEIAFVYGGTPGMSAEELALAEQMSKYWVAFAQTGDPNHAGAVAQWPAVTEQADDVVLRLDVASSGDGIKAQHGLRKAACDWQDGRPQ
eukprot:SAG22_NODE_18_length_32591_cov_38.043549_13_plen_213_part_00